METTGITETPPDHIREAFSRLKLSEARLRATSVDERIEKLARLESIFLESEAAILEALDADLSKPYEEVQLTEINPVLLELRHARRNLSTWMKPKRVRTPLFLTGTTSEIRYEAKGVGLIISPWNYTINLTFGPLVGAVAAGCPVVIKPSEFTPATARVVAEILDRVFSDDEVVVLQGSVPTSMHLLSHPFRHIYFTGSPAVGRVVMEAASHYLAGVTLELGGKSPAILDATADLELAAKKIVFGKFANAGQTCIAPDYLLVEASVADAFLVLLKQEIERAFGSSSSLRQQSPDYSRIVSTRHTERLIEMLDDAVDSGASVAIGGHHDVATRYIEPTILTSVPDGARVMEEEIFGPILPVLTYETSNEAIARANSMTPPLSMYVFSTQSDQIERFLSEIPAGGACVNETLLHFANPELPFGGLNQSGSGRGHGHAGFLAFTNEKAVLRQHLGHRVFGLVSPPYTDLTRRLVRRIRSLI